MDYSLLDTQATFLQSKDKLEWALPLAQRAVIAAPSEFGTWSKLAEIYVGLERWDLALLTLNSCPMFTYTDKDAPRMPEPAKVNLPVLSSTALDEIDESVQTYDTEMVHPNLRKLSAAGYKGTFLKAYSLLTDVTSKIGWDQLLRIRSQVFVMEEEYRSEKSQPGTGRNTGRPITGKNPSTTALRAPSPEVNGNGANGEASEKPDEDAEGSKSPATGKSKTEDDDADSAVSGVDDSIEKPEHTVASTEVKSGNEDVSLSTSPALLPRKPHSVRVTTNPPSPTPLTPTTPTSSTNASASAGSTISSWSSTKTSASTPSGAPTWPAPQKPPTTPTLPPPPPQPYTAKARRSGRSSASWRSGYIICRRLSRPIRVV